MSLEPGRLAPLGFLAVAAVAAFAAHQIQLVADSTRPPPGYSESRVFLPDPRSMKVAVMDFDTVAADLFWVRTVLSFAEIYEGEERSGQQWLSVMLLTVCELDPPWRTVYFYGGSMLRTVDDIDGSDALFERASREIPGDAYFPFSIAMNAYLYHKDIDKAVAYMNAAAALPNAPEWYHLAAAGFLDREGQRAAALRYLEEQIRDERDEAIRQRLQDRYNEVAHDELAAQMEEARLKFKASRGVDIARPEDLGTLPSDPLGGQWIIGAEGTIHSDVRERALRARAMRRERNQLTRLWPR